MGKRETDRKEKQSRQYFRLTQLINGKTNESIVLHHDQNRVDLILALSLTLSVAPIPIYFPFINTTDPTRNIQIRGTRLPAASSASVSLQRDGEDGSGSDDDGSVPAFDREGTSFEEVQNSLTTGIMTRIDNNAINPSLSPPRETIRRNDNDHTLGTNSRMSGTDTTSGTNSSMSGTNSSNTLDNTREGEGGSSSSTEETSGMNSNSKFDNGTDAESNCLDNGDVDDDDDDDFARGDSGLDDDDAESTTTTTTTTTTAAKVSTDPSSRNIESHDLPVDIRLTATATPSSSSRRSGSHNLLVDVGSMPIATSSRTNESTSSRVMPDPTKQQTCVSHKKGDQYVGYCGHSKNGIIDVRIHSGAFVHKCMFCHGPMHGNICCFAELDDPASFVCFTCAGTFYPSKKAFILQERLKTEWGIASVPRGSLFSEGHDGSTPMTHVVPTVVSEVPTIPNLQQLETPASPGGHIDIGSTTPSPSGTNSTTPSPSGANGSHNLPVDFGSTAASSSLTSDNPTPLAAGSVSAFSGLKAARSTSTTSNTGGFGLNFAVPAVSTASTAVSVVPTIFEMPTVASVIDVNNDNNNNNRKLSSSSSTSTTLNTRRGGLKDATNTASKFPRHPTKSIRNSPPTVPGPGPGKKVLWKSPIFTTREDDTNGDPCIPVRYNMDQILLEEPSANLDHSSRSFATSQSTGASNHSNSVSKSTTVMMMAQQPSAVQNAFSTASMESSKSSVGPTASESASNQYSLKAQDGPVRNSEAARSATALQFSTTAAAPSTEKPCSTNTGAIKFQVEIPSKGKTRYFDYDEDKGLLCEQALCATRFLPTFRTDDGYYTVIVLSVQETEQSGISKCLLFYASNYITNSMPEQPVRGVAAIHTDIDTVLARVERKVYSNNTFVVMKPLEKFVTKQGIELPPKFEYPSLK